MVKGKQTNKNQYKYFHPFSLDQLTVQYMYIYSYAHCAGALLRAKKGQLKGPTLKKTTGLCPFRCYYSMYQSFFKLRDREVHDNLVIYYASLLAIYLG